jgi:hypothetical protein
VSKRSRFVAIRDVSREPADYAVVSCLGWDSKLLADVLMGVPNAFIRSTITLAVLQVAKTARLWEGTIAEETM